MHNRAREQCEGCAFLRAKRVSCGVNASHARRERARGENLYVTLLPLASPAIRLFSLPALAK